MAKLRIIIGSDQMFARFFCCGHQLERLLQAFLPLSPIPEAVSTPLFRPPRRQSPRPSFAYPGGSPHAPPSHTPKQPPRIAAEGLHIKILNLIKLINTVPHGKLLCLLIYRLSMLRQTVARLAAFAEAVAGSAESAQPGPRRSYESAQPGPQRSYL